MLESASILTPEAFRKFLLRFQRGNAGLRLLQVQLRRHIDGQELQPESPVPLPHEVPYRAAAVTCTKPGAQAAKRVSE